MTNPQQPMSTRWPLTPSSLMIFLQTDHYTRVNTDMMAGQQDPGDQSESVDSRHAGSRTIKKMQISLIYTTYKGTGKNDIV